MKNQNSLLILCFLIPLIISCTSQNSDRADNLKISNADLIGKWNQIGTNKSTKESIPEIDFFRILNDSIVEIQITDSTGNRIITGNWENGYVKKIGSTGIEVKSDIKIAYKLSDNHSHIIALKLSKNNGETVMHAHNYKFVKE